VISILRKLKDMTEFASLQQLERPEPPTPIRRAFPLGNPIILQILMTCSHASENSIKFMVLLSSLF